MNRKRNARIRNVAVVINLIGASGRDLLSGVFRYAREKCHWRISLFKNAREFSPSALEKLLPEGLDGILLSDHPDPNMEEWIESLKIPLAVIGRKGAWFPRRKENIVFLQNDDEEIGRLGAQYLCEQGLFRSFGFVPCYDRRYWSLLREKGFRAELRKRKMKDVRVFHSSVPVVPNGDIPELAKWLSEIPKPAAVMAAYDDRASNVLSAAEEASIPVPDQLNVIGVDNDGLICDFTNPPLSSIWPDHEALGARAAGELARLMEEGGGTTSMTIRVRAMRVVTRDTTGFVTPSARIVERALAFIGKNAALPLTPDDVARALRVSRRLADLRFHEQAGTTLAEAISEARLALVAKQLTETDEPIGRIARKLSFPNVNSLGNRFRARYGLSMREWRKR